MAEDNNPNRLFQDDSVSDFEGFDNQEIEWDCPTCKNIVITRMSDADCQWSHSGD